MSYQSLMQMEEHEFFAQSIGFILNKMKSVAQGQISASELRHYKAMVDFISCMRKPLPQWPDKGWLMPYLLQGDEVFGSQRWAWWSQCLIDGKVAGAIPEIKFCSNESELSVQETLAHIEDILRKVENTGTGTSLMIFIKWLLWGFGSSRIEEKQWSKKIDQTLYQEFQLGKIQQNPYDYFANLAQEVRKGNNRWINPTEFYKTPPSICRMMVKRIFSDKQCKEVSILDPCAGTGTMLLEASNYSVNLYAQEISWDLCMMLEANAFLYMPWMVYSAPWLKPQASPIRKGVPELISQSKRHIVVDETKVDLQQLELFG